MLVSPARPKHASTPLLLLLLAFLTLTNTITFLHMQTVLAYTASPSSHSTTSLPYNAAADYFRINLRRCDLFNKNQSIGDTLLDISLDDITTKCLPHRYDYFDDETSYTCQDNESFVQIKLADDLSRFLVTLPLKFVPCIIATNVSFPCTYIIPDADLYFGSNATCQWVAHDWDKIQQYNDGVVHFSEDVVSISINSNLGLLEGLKAPFFRIKFPIYQNNKWNGLCSQSEFYWRENYQINRLNASCVAAYYILHADEKIVEDFAQCTYNSTLSLSVSNDNVNGSYSMSSQSIDILQPAKHSTATPTSKPSSPLNAMSAAPSPIPSTSPSNPPKGASQSTDCFLILEEHTEVTIIIKTLITIPISLKNHLYPKIYLPSHISSAHDLVIDARVDYVKRACNLLCQLLKTGDLKHSWTFRFQPVVSSGILGSECTQASNINEINSYLDELSRRVTEEKFTETKIMKSVTINSSYLIPCHEFVISVRSTSLIMNSSIDLVCSTLVENYAIPTSMVDLASCLLNSYRVLQGNQTLEVTRGILFKSFDSSMKFTSTTEFEVKKLNAAIKYNWQLFPLQSDSPVWVASELPVSQSSGKSLIIPPGVLQYHRNWLLLYSFIYDNRTFFEIILVDFHLDPLHARISGGNRIVDFRSEVFVDGTSSHNYLVDTITVYSWSCWVLNPSIAQVDFPNIFPTLEAAGYQTTTQLCSNCAFIRNNQFSGAHSNNDYRNDALLVIPPYTLPPGSYVKICLTVSTALGPFNSTDCIVMFTLKENQVQLYYSTGNRNITGLSSLKFSSSANIVFDSDANLATSAYWDRELAHYRVNSFNNVSKDDVHVIASSNMFNQRLNSSLSPDHIDFKFLPFCISGVGSSNVSQVSPTFSWTLSNYFPRKSTNISLLQISQSPILILKSHQFLVGNSYLLSLSVSCSSEDSSSAFRFIRPYSSILITVNQGPKDGQLLVSPEEGILFFKTVLYLEMVDWIALDESQYPLQYSFSVSSGQLHSSAIYSNESLFLSDWSFQFRHKSICPFYTNLYSPDFNESASFVFRVNGFVRDSLFSVTSYDKELQGRFVNHGSSGALKSIELNQSTSSFDSSELPLINSLLLMQHSARQDKHLSDSYYNETALLLHTLRIYYENKYQISMPNTEDICNPRISYGLSVQPTYFNVPTESLIANVIQIMRSFLSIQRYSNYYSNCALDFLTVVLSDLNKLLTDTYYLDGNINRSIHSSMRNGCKQFSAFVKVGGLLESVLSCAHIAFSNLLSTVEFCDSPLLSVYWHKFGTIIKLLQQAKLSCRAPTDGYQNMMSNIVNTNASTEVNEYEFVIFGAEDNRQVVKRNVLPTSNVSMMGLRVMMSLVELPLEAMYTQDNGDEAAVDQLAPPSSGRRLVSNGVLSMCEAEIHEEGCKDRFISSPYSGQSLDERLDKQFQYVADLLSRKYWQPTNFLSTIPFEPSFRSMFVDVHLLNIGNPLLPAETSSIDTSSFTPLIPQFMINEDGVSDIVIVSFESHFDDVLRQEQLSNSYAPNASNAASVFTFNVEIPLSNRLVELNALHDSLSNDSSPRWMRCSVYDIVSKEWRNPAWLDGWYSPDVLLYSNSYLFKDAQTDASSQNYVTNLLVNKTYWIDSNSSACNETDASCFLPPSLSCEVSQLNFEEPIVLQWRLLQQVADPCNKCSNHGVCVLLMTSPICLCEDGFSGRYCEVNSTYHGNSKSTLKWDYSYSSRKHFYIGLLALFCIIFAAIVLCGLLKILFPMPTARFSLQFFLPMMQAEFINRLTDIRLVAPQIASNVSHLTSFVRSGIVTVLTLFTVDSNVSDFNNKKDVEIYSDVDFQNEADHDDDVGSWNISAVGSTQESKSYIEGYSLNSLLAPPKIRKKGSYTILSQRELAHQAEENRAINRKFHQSQGLYSPVKDDDVEFGGTHDHEDLSSMSDESNYILESIHADDVEDDDEMISGSSQSKAASTSWQFVGLRHRR